VVTVEAGQGGPGRGTTSSPEKARAPSKPVDPKNPMSKKQLMGWVDIDEYLGPDAPAAAAG